MRLVATRRFPYALGLGAILNGTAERSMNVLQSICCLFSRGCGDEPTTSTRRNESPVAKADLGQTEAGLEKSGKEQMGHMEGDEAQDNRQP